MKFYEALSTREREIFNHNMDNVRKHKDRMFMWLFIGQWFFTMGIALWFTPFTYNGTERAIHPHVLMAIFVGGLLSAFPIFRLSVHRGAKANGYIVAVAQMCYSTLLIHITNGRIETHFHIFGSLAFLSFYRNPKVILLATVLTASDHIFRGAFATTSIYGVAEASIFRALEHAWWVVFEDVFLLKNIISQLEGGALFAQREAALENAINNIEKTVNERTAELVASQQQVLDQQQSLINSARLSSLGEMAAGIAHEINNPLAIISTVVMDIRKKQQKQKLTPELLEDRLVDIDQTILRMTGIIQGLRNISRDSSRDKLEHVAMTDVMKDVLAICAQKFRNHSVDLRYNEEKFAGVSLPCRRVQLAQVLMNLLNNGFDAVQELDGEKWIEIDFIQKGDQIVLVLTDSGSGIPEEVAAKIFQPFFTTKDVGKGTGLGLSLSKTIVENHGGTLEIGESEHTQFKITLPLKAA